MVYARALGARDFGRAGSSPVIRTIIFHERQVFTRFRGRAFRAPARDFRLFAREISALQRFAQHRQRLRHGEARKIYSAMGILSIAAYAFAAIFLALRLAKPLWLTIFLALEILGSVAILFFSNDPTGAKRCTVAGVVHWLLAIANFALLFVFIVNAESKVTIFYRTCRRFYRLRQRSCASFFTLLSRRSLSRRSAENSSVSPSGSF